MKHAINNASVTRLCYTDEGKFIIESINDMRYLQDGL
ncbi:phosphoglycerate mutase [Erwinia tracheiphila PSU-1]|nr:phosphoglycerate mutase [Erwinia tracheiphila PSU-1]